MPAIYTVCNTGGRYVVADAEGHVIREELDRASARAVAAELNAQPPRKVLPASHRRH
jgi:hypothetical protein